MTLHYADNLIELHHGHALDVAKTLPTASVQTIVTSPPYFGLRDYGEEGQIGAETSVAAYVEALVSLFRELRRVLADDGTLWLNLGDTYNNRTRVRGSSHQPGVNNVTDSESWATTAGDGGVRMSSNEFGLKEKDLFGIPWRVAFALQQDGWILRSDIIWHKPNGMPESVTDRPSKSHEYVFLLAKSKRYFYDADAISEPATSEQSDRALSFAREGKKAVVPGQSTRQKRLDRTGPQGDTSRRNRRDVWTVSPVPFAGAHFAVYPPELIRPCILAGSRRGDTVLDPFSGSGTTGMVATQEGRRYVGIDLNAEYLDLSLRTRFAQPVLDMTGGDA